MSAFYASHSLMWDMPPVLTEIAQSYGIEGHKVLGIQRLGVSRTSQHWELPDEQNQAKKALMEGNVDAFVMSPIGMPDPGIDNFVKLGLEHNPNAKFYIQISWPGMGLVDNNDMESTMGGMFGGRGPGAPAGGAPANKAAVPDGAGSRGGFGGGMMGGGAQGAPAGGAPANKAATRGGTGGRGGMMGGGMMGGGQDYNKTPE
jgi:hypothetical protein